MKKVSRRRVRAVAIAIGAASTASLWSTAALAWGAEAHQTTGRLADALLVGSRAQAQVQRILGMNLQQAALWADCAKGVQLAADGTWAYQPDPQRHPECLPFETPAEEARLVAYVARNDSACKHHPAEDTCHRQYHYTDVATQRDHYEAGLAGTHDHDLVAALQAATRVLQGQPAPAPFAIDGPREALLLVSHLVGDLHQPLHVQAVYLDPAGHVVDPDHGRPDRHTRTAGGNALMDGRGNLHQAWDGVPRALGPDQLGLTGLAEARAVPATTGPVGSWASQWATDTLRAAAPVFAGVHFSAEDGHHHWQATLPPHYADDREALQRAQLLKAGARLAQLLREIWP
jgi:hypothetical protein